jgi:hypothetical protein
MRTLNMVRELMTRLVGLTAPPQRKPPFVCGECERGSEHSLQWRTGRRSRGPRAVHGREPVETRLRLRPQGSVQTLGSDRRSFAPARHGEGLRAHIKHRLRTAT